MRTVLRKAFDREITLARKLLIVEVILRGSVLRNWLLNSAWAELSFCGKRKLPTPGKFAGRVFGAYQPVPKGCV